MVGISNLNLTKGDVFELQKRYNIDYSGKGADWW
jgi:hypothetical protein